MAEECGSCPTLHHLTGTSQSNTSSGWKYRQSSSGTDIMEQRQSSIHHHTPTRSCGFLQTTSTNSINTFLSPFTPRGSLALKVSFISALLTSCVSKGGRVVASLERFFPWKIKAHLLSTPCKGNGARRTALLISRRPTIYIVAATQPGLVYALGSGAKFGGEKGGS